MVLCPDPRTLVPLRSRLALGVLAAVTAGVSCARHESAASGNSSSAPVCPIKAATLPDWASSDSMDLWSMADSLVSVGARTGGPDPSSVTRLVASWRAGRRSISPDLIASAFLRAPKQTMNVGALTTVAFALAAELRAGRISPSALVTRSWTRTPFFSDRWFVLFALRRAGADTSIISADATIACLELNSVAVIFTPGTATTLMDLSIDTGALVMALENLASAGTAGRNALNRIRRFSEANPQLAAFVSRILQGLEFQHAFRVTPRF
jgi:hypothetical protein